MEIDNSPRTAGHRKQDVLARLEKESDIWIATADADGLPYLVPLWFKWDGEAIWLVTRITNPTGRNLSRLGRARLSFGDTDDVVIFDATVETFRADEVPAAAADAYAARWGWDPRGDARTTNPYAYFRAVPRSAQAWHGRHELRGRNVMSEGEWTADR